MKREAPSGVAPAFGEEAHRVLAHARAAARRLRHDHLGTEHLLLGLLEEPRGLACSILYQAGIQPAQVRKALELLAPPGHADLETEFVMAPALRHALRLAPEEARRLGDDEVRSEHLLLAALHEGSGHAAVALRAMGLRLEALRLAVARERPGGAEAHVPAGWMPNGPFQVLAWFGAAAIVAALGVTLWWIVAVHSFRWLSDLYLLLVPLALLGMGLVGLGASRMEAQRSGAAIEALVESWRARRAPAQIVQSLRLAEAGQEAAARDLLLLAVARPMPEAEYRAALPAIAQWVAREPWSALGLRARAELHFRADHAQPAIADLAQAIQREPQHASWHHLLGSVQAHAGHWREATDAYRETCRLNADTGAYWADLAVALMRLGALAEAEAAAERSIELSPELPLASITRAALDYLRDRLDDADAALVRALALDSDDVWAHALLIAVLLRRGEAARALAEAHEFALALGEPPAVFTAIEGWSQAALGRRADALSILADARARAPELPSLLDQLARALQEQGYASSALYHRALAAQLAG